MRLFAGRDLNVQVRHTKELLNFQLWWNTDCNTSLNVHVPVRNLIQPNTSIHILYFVFPSLQHRGDLWRGDEWERGLVWFLCSNLCTCCTAEHVLYSPKQIETRRIGNVGREDDTTKTYSAALRKHWWDCGVVLGGAAPHPVHTVPAVCCGYSSPADWLKCTLSSSFCCTHPDWISDRFSTCDTDGDSGVWLMDNCWDVRQHSHLIRLDYFKRTDLIKARAATMTAINTERELNMSLESHFTPSPQLHCTHLVIKKDEKVVHAAWTYRGNTTYIKHVYFLLKSPRYWLFVRYHTPGCSLVNDVTLVKFHASGLPWFSKTSR